MITAKFGDKKFEVSDKKIYTPSGLSISEEIDIEEKEVSGKKPTVTVKGIKRMSFTCELKLDARFVTVKSEIDWWQKTLRAKVPQAFYLNSIYLGGFYLTKVDIKDFVLAKQASTFLSAVLSLSFSEEPVFTNPETKKAKKPQLKIIASKTEKKKTTAESIKKGSRIKPKSNVRWYYTAEGAIKKSGKSGKAYQKVLTVTYTYTKSGKIVCVNPQGLGWLKVEDVSLVSSASSGSTSKQKTQVSKK